MVNFPVILSDGHLLETRIKDLDGLKHCTNFFLVCVFFMFLLGCLKKGLAYEICCKASSISTLKYLKNMNM